MGTAGHREHPAAVASPSKARGDVAVWLAFLFGLLIYVIGQFEPYTWVLRDGRFYVDSNETLLEDLTYEEAFARSWYEEELGWNRRLPAGFSNVALGARGELYHFRPYLLPVMASPFYFGLGLYGVLLFNLLCYGVIAGCGYLIAARFAGRRAAAVATGLWIFGTSLIETAYDYSVDALLLALFAGAMELLFRRRGFLAGLCIAGTLIIKPTSLFYVPAAAALLFELPRGTRKAVFLRAIAGGATGLGVAALINTYMYGAPWLFGYNRVVEVVGGEIQLASTGDRFQTPLLDGLERTFSGGYGLGRFYGVFIATLFGLWPMLRRHTWVTLATLLSVGGSLVVFSLYDWESDRFQYVSFLILLPMLAWGLRAMVRTIQRLSLALGRRRPARIALLFGLAAGLTSMAQSVRDGRLHPWREQVGIHALRDAIRAQPTETAIALVSEHGTLNLEGVQPSVSDRESPVSLGRFGTWWPRGNLVMVALSAAADHFSMRPVLHGLLAFLGFFFLGTASRGFGPAPARLALLAVALSIHPLREMVAFGGASLFAFVAIAAALAALRTGRPRTAFIAATCGAFFLSAPLLLLPFLGALWCHRPKGGRSLRYWLTPALSVGLWAVYGLLIYGRPFEGPEAFVLIDGERFSVSPSGPLASLQFLEQTLRGVHPGRSTLALAAFASVATLWVAIRQRAPWTLAWVGIALLAPFIFPSGLWEVALLAPLVPVGAELVSTLATRRWFRALYSHRALAIATVLLLALGTARRVATASAPIDIASAHAVRHADVFLGSYPCDFLAWEHMTWECAHYDGGVENRTGLQLPRGPRVGGTPTTLFVVPSGRDGRRTRRVAFAPLEEGRHTFRLRWVIPDAHRNDARLRIRFGEQTLFEGTVAVGDAFDEHTFEVDGAGRLEVEVQGEPGSPTAVGFTGSISR